MKSIGFDLIDVTDVPKGKPNRKELQKNINQSNEATINDLEEGNAREEQEGSVTNHANPSPNMNSRPSLGKTVQVEDSSMNNITQIERRSHEKKQH